MDPWNKVKVLSSSMEHAVQYLNRHAEDDEWVAVERSWAAKQTIQGLVDRGVLETWVDDGLLFVRLVKEFR